MFDTDRRPSAWTAPLPVWAGALMAALGGTVVWRVLMQRGGGVGVGADRRTWRKWCFWHSCLYLLPFVDFGYYLLARGLREVGLKGLHCSAALKQPTLHLWMPRVSMAANFMPSPKQLLMTSF